MVKISHPSMRRARDNYVQEGSTPESYMVEDATAIDNSNSQVSFVTPPIGPPEEIKREHIVDPPKPEVEPEVKNILNDLIFLGSASKYVNIGTHRFKISTLTHREHNLLMKELYKFGDGADLFTMRTLTLAFALRAVDDTPLENLPMPNEYDSDFDKKMAIIDSMQMNVVTKLYDTYNELSDEVDENLLGEEIKN